MAQPVVHDTSQRLYDSLGTGLTAEDAANDWATLYLADSVGALLGAVDDIVRDQPDSPGWASSLDVDDAPEGALPWLAQFVGVRFYTALATAEMRERIRNKEGWQRGTPASIEAAVALHLTGTKAVRITERDTSPYHFLVRTYTVETPDEPAVLAEIQRQKPAGLQFVLEVADGETYDVAGGAYLTYNALGAGFATYDDLTNWIAP